MLADDRADYAPPTASPAELAQELGYYLDAWSLDYFAGASLTRVCSLARRAAGLLATYPDPVAIGDLESRLARAESERDDAQGEIEEYKDRASLAEDEARDARRDCEAAQEALETYRDTLATPDDGEIRGCLMDAREEIRKLRDLLEIRTAERDVLQRQILERDSLPRTRKRRSDAGKPRGKKAVQS